MTTTAQDLEEVLYRGFDSVRELAIEHILDIERAYLNAGKKGLAITGKLTISDGKESGAYEYEPRITFTVEQVNEPGLRQTVNTKQQELPFGEGKGEPQVCVCKIPWPVSIDGHSFICMTCLAEFPSDEALEYFEAWAQWTLPPIDPDSPWWWGTDAKLSEKPLEEGLQVWQPGVEKAGDKPGKKKRKKKGAKKSTEQPAGESQEELATLF